jgi:plastocyanin
MMAFSPPSDTVHVGNIVRMQNNDSITHVIQPSVLGGPNWGTISGGRSADFTATAVGTWPYECTVASHTMHGELVILP